MSTNTWFTPQDLGELISVGTRNPDFLPDEEERDEKMSTKTSISSLFDVVVNTTDWVVCNGKKCVWIIILETT